MVRVTIKHAARKNNVDLLLFIKQTREKVVAGNYRENFMPALAHGRQHKTTQYPLGSEGCVCMLCGVNKTERNATHVFCG